MQFRRNGQRDSRRRRVLSETSLGRLRPSRTPWTGNRAATAPSQRLSPNYGDALFMDEQARLTDLLPQSLMKIFLLFIVGLLIIAGLEGLYAWMPSLAPLTSDGRVAAFDLDGEGSLAVWFSSTTFLISALVAAIVYTVRRHKSDDYQGHYRVWLWAAMCWLILSLDETASLHEGFKEMMAYLTGTRLFGDGSMWWVIAYFFLLGGVGTRLLVDMRCCRLSTAAMLMVAGCYATAILAQLEWILPADARGVMLEEGAEMTGNLFLLLAMTLHARYVILDAEGLLPRREEKEQNEKLADDGYAYEDAEEEQYEYDEEEVAAEQAVLFGQTVKVHPPHGVTRRGSAQSHSSGRRASDAFSAGMQAAESQVGRRLTKQEKKALRRRLEKQRRRRSA